MLSSGAVIQSGHNIKTLCNFVLQQNHTMNVTDEYEQESPSVFSKAWNDTDVVLVVEDEEFHVHRSILSLQSVMFKTMFNGLFKDATKERIELKDDKAEAMLLFLKLLYPPNILDHFNADGDTNEVNIDDENIFDILELADKYQAVSIIRQCMAEIKHLKPETTMRLFPYAVRYDLPLGKIYDVISRRISTNKLENFAPQLNQLHGVESFYDQCLLKKCRFLENLATQAYTTILCLVKEVVSRNKTVESVYCTTGSFLQSLSAADFERTTICKCCYKAYKDTILGKYVFSSASRVISMGPRIRGVHEGFDSVNFQDTTITSLKLMSLLNSLYHITLKSK